MLKFCFDDLRWDFLKAVPERKRERLRYIQGHLWLDRHDPGISIILAKKKEKKKDKRMRCSNRKETKLERIIKERCV